MFADMHTPYMITALFFLVCVAYIYASIMTLANDPMSKSRRDYFLAGIVLSLSCLFYGMMTIAISERVRWFWAAGFIPFFLFLPAWIRFISNIVTIKNKVLRIIARRILLIVCLIIAVICVASDEVVFVNTAYGYQFSYQGSLLFKAVGILVLAISSCVVILNIRWWRESVKQRSRTQQRILVYLTFLGAIGIVTDFIVPIITQYTLPPLAVIAILPGTLQLYVSMSVNKTLSITIPNASRYIFKSVTIPILVLDHENTISLENKAALDFFGESHVGKNISGAIVFSEKAPELSSYDKDIANANVTVETPSGKRLCDMLLSVETDKYGDALCKVVILRDITENVGLICDLRETSEQLEVALRQANAASKAKSDFLSNMSHEMRTPMNAIIGMTTIGKSAEDLDGKHHALSKIGNASSHLLGVINDVLDMAKIEADKLELSPTSYYFRKMLENVVAVIGFRVDEKMQLLSLNVDDRIPQVVIGDEHRLAQVITNILANAVKFTPEKGSIRLEAFLDAETDDQCLLRMVVTDSGIGISPEQQKKLFVAFEQVEGGISREYGGTGLGLVISKRIIELMGGEIWVESESDKGARFIFTVNVMRGSKEPSATEDNDSASERATSHAHSDGNAGDGTAGDGEFAGKKLLVAEDVEINREILISLLESTGLAIDCADNGKEAFEMIAAAPGRYDMVFMDMQMPQMDGLESTRRIRTLPACGSDKLPIVAMTANVFKDDIESCLAVGMNDHLSKPIDIDRIIEVLRRYLGGAKT